MWSVQNHYVCMVLVVCGLNSLKFWKNLGFTTKKRLKTTILNILEFLLIFVNLTEKLCKKCRCKKCRCASTLFSHSTKSAPKKCRCKKCRCASTLFSHSTKSAPKKCRCKKCRCGSTLFSHATKIEKKSRCKSNSKLTQL